MTDMQVRKRTVLGAVVLAGRSRGRAARHRGSGQPPMRRRSPRRITPSRLVWAGTALGLVLLLSPAVWQVPRASGQQASESAQAAPGAAAQQSPTDEDPATDASGKPERAKPRGRLPAYYGRVVSASQREEIYKVQAKFNAQIDQLQEQLDALERERDEAVDELLTEDQLKRIAAYREQARARRADRQQADSADAGGDSAGTPANDTP